MLRSPLLAVRHYYRSFPAMDGPAEPNLQWEPAYRPPSSSPHSPSYLGSSGLDYPSPVASVAASYASDMPFPQIPSSIGPARVLTRRQRAALEHTESHGRRSTTFPSIGMSDGPRSPSVSLYDSPRPHSPHAQRRLSESSSLLGPLAMHYPTPDSTSTPFSPQGYFDHSQTASSSNSKDRSASPALSAITTSSSHSHTSNPQFASFPPSVDSRKPKQRKQRLFNLDRRAICEFHRDFPSARQEDIAAKYGVERSTISKILKHKVKWLNVPADEDMRIAKHRPSKFPIVEDKMVLWLAKPDTPKSGLTDLRIRQKAREIALAMGLTEDRFKASSGWVENFKHRHGIRGGVWTNDGPKSGARKARALGLGTFDTQEAFLSCMPPDYDEYPIDDRRGKNTWDPHPVSHALPIEIPSASHMDDVHHHPSSPALEHHQSPLEHHSSMASHTPIDPVQTPEQQFPPTEDGLLPAIYHDGTVVYQPPQDEAARIPTLAEADDYFNRVLLFFDSPGEGKGLLNREQRDALHTIKGIMFNAASGIRPHH